MDGAGFPPGVFNVVCGQSRELGAALASHPGVDKVAPHHYDVDCCRHEEGYAGLVVHGPSTFSYRLVSPLTLGQGLVVSRSEPAV